MNVKPFINVITLAVEDLERSLAFYRDGMGLETEGIFGTEFEHGAVVFFYLRSGLILALWPKSSLSAEANIPLSEIRSGGITLANNVRSKAEVDDVMGQAARAGATITDPARDRFFSGYSGYFRDPDGHIWEVIWNPGMEPEDWGTGIGNECITGMRVNQASTIIARAAPATWPAEIP
jgi:catechol 2,3-dioxygenase-like lactoylglutathione lyase family enzyme